MSSAFLSGLWVSVRSCSLLQERAALTFFFAASCLPPSHLPSSTAHRITPKEVLHCSCRQAESRQARQLYGGRVLRARRVPGEHTHRLQGGKSPSFAPRQGPITLCRNSSAPLSLLSSSNSPSPPSRGRATTSSTSRPSSPAPPSAKITSIPTLRKKIPRALSSRAYRASTATLDGFSKTASQVRFCSLPNLRCTADQVVVDADDLTNQASALAIRNTSSAVARVLGSAAGASYRCEPVESGLTLSLGRRVLVDKDLPGSRASVRDGCSCSGGGRSKWDRSRVRRRAGGVRISRVRKNNAPAGYPRERSG